MNCRASRARLAGLILVLAAVALVVPWPAAGHAFLVQTTPRPGERLSSPPPGVQLRFSEPVVSAELRVSRADGSPASDESARRSEGGLVVETRLGELDDGIYVVAYQVAAEDAHVTAGEFAFAVGNIDDASLAEAAGGSDEGVPWRQAVARWLLVAGLLLSAGALVSERFVWRPVVPEGSRLPVLPVGWFTALAALGAVGGVATLLLAPRDAADAMPLLSLPALALVTQLVLLAVAAQLVLLAPLRRWAAGPLAVALGLVVVGGHPASQGIGPAAASVVHLGAVAVWTGGLLHAALVVWRFRTTRDAGWVRHGVARYASAALVVAAVVLVSGAVLALAEFRRPAELFDTAYGRLLLAKLAFVAVALALALLARLRGLGLGRNRPFRARLLSRITRLEAVALLGALALASLVASLPPPSAARGAAYLLGPPPLDGPVLRSADLAGSMAVHLAAAPGRLELRALGFSGDGIAEAELRLSGEQPDGGGMDLQPRDCGPGCWTTALTWPRGTTTLRADLSAPDWAAASVEFTVSWPPAPEAPERLDAVLEAMRAEPEVVMTEQVSSGPGMTGETHTFRRGGEEFARRELYAAGGATDIHPVPPRTGAAALTLYLPGSAIWFRLELDAHDRIVAATIISPGHRIERTFSYSSDADGGDAESPDPPSSSSSVSSIASGGSSPRISRTTTPSASTK